MNNTSTDLGSVSRTPSHSATTTTAARSYFPPQPPAQSPSAQSRYLANSLPAANDAAVDETLSNTLANSAPRPSAHRADPSTPLIAPVAVRPAKFTEEWDASQRGSSIIDGPVLHAGPASTSTMQRSNSLSGSIGPSESVNLSRSNTLKKKPSLRRGGSLKRSGSRRSMKAGSVRSLALQSNTDEDEQHSAFHCPVPTTGNPTEALAGRFQSWRKILKDLISYFREIQTHYEHRAKSLQKLGNVLNGSTMPPGFLASGGLDDAMQILAGYNKQAIVESVKAREIEEDVILALTGLRSDLRQKIKEIKNLSSDFKNSVDKEMDATKKAVDHLQGSLGQADLDPALTTGKQDPYLLRLTVDRQLERQIDEENYLHQAYLNLETSGRELESIVVGEIQKSYNAYAGILKRESDTAYNAVEELRVGPIAMPKDHEWIAFVRGEGQLVDPEVPIRSTEQIHYPGRDHYACQEIRAGLLERKSKYLKSYTAGWYVLSPTHLHEFKSADKTQAPVMSLYLPEQKLGSHSTEGGSSNKFVLKGRQTGTLHRGHTWVFRAESHDTMMAWYEDIKALTEKTPEERSNFVRVHSRSFSRSSQRSFSSDGVVDEDDDEPFAATHTNLVNNHQPKDEVPPPRRPEGGRFPSDLEVNAQRGLQAPLSPSSLSSGINESQDHDAIAAAAALPGSGFGNQSTSPSAALAAPAPAAAGSADHTFGYGSTIRTPMEEAPSHAAIVSRDAQEDGVNPYTSIPIRRRGSSNYKDALGQQQQRQQQQQQQQQSLGGIVGGPRELGNQESDGIERVEFQPPENQTAGGSSSTALANGVQPTVVGTGVGMGDYMMSPPAVQKQATPTYAELEPSPQSAAVGPNLDGVSLATLPATGKSDGPGYETELSQTQTSNTVGQYQSNAEQQPVDTTARDERMATTAYMHIPGEYPRGAPVG